MEVSTAQKPASTSEKSKSNEWGTPGSDINSVTRSALHFVIHFDVLKMKRPPVAKLLISCVILHLTALSVWGDQEAPNRIYVQSSTYGAYYAKCIPDERYGTNGKTLLYHVQEEEDVLVHTFDWYSNPVYLRHTAWGVSVIRVGPWHRGRNQSENHLAVALYLNSELLKEYNTKEIAKLGSAQESVSHYTVFQKHLGYRWIDSNDYAFDLQLHNGRILSLDVKTGEILKESKTSDVEAIPDLPQ